MQSKFNILISNTGWLYLGKVFTQFFSVIVTVLVIRELAIETWGVYNFLIGSIALINVFALSSITSVFQRFVPEFIYSKNYAHVRKLLQLCMYFSIIIFTVLLALIYIFRLSFGEFFNIPNIQDHIIFFLFFVFGSFLRGWADSLSRSFLFHKFNSIVQISTNFMRAIVLVVILDELTVNALLLVEGATAVLFSILILFYCLRQISLDEKVSDNSPFPKKRVMRYGKFSSLNELGASIVNKTSDYFIIAAISNPTQVGIYAFSYRIFTIINQVLPVQDFFSVLRPLFIQKFNDNATELELNKMIELINKFLISVFLFPTLLFFCFGSEIIKYFFDEKYLTSLPIIKVILISYIQTAIFFPIGLVVILKERMDIALKSKLVVVLSIIGGIFAMKKFGIMGVVLVTTVCDFIRNFYIYYWTKKNIRIKLELGFLKYNILVSGLIYMIYFFVNLNIYNQYVLALHLVVFSFLYLLFNVVLHSFSQLELNMLMNSLETKGRYRWMKKLIFFLMKILKTRNNLLKNV